MMQRATISSCAIAPIHHEQRFPSPGNDLDASFGPPPIIIAPFSRENLLNRDNLLLLPLLSLASLPLFCQQRDPVLQQVDVPHRYYYREMYLPQLTSGPSAAAWTPDSRALVYSMAGSLWRQRLDSNTAEQLTQGPGYDYQPDCSSDGRWVVFSSYQKHAIELWVVNLESKHTQELTFGGAVNVEPRDREGHFRPLVCHRRRRPRLCSERRVRSLTAITSSRSAISATLRENWRSASKWSVRPSKSPVRPSLGRVAPKLQQISETLEPSPSSAPS